MNLKKELYTIFEHPTLHKYGLLIQCLIFFNILISIIIMFLQTEKSLSNFFPFFNLINFFNVLLFTLEYILRVYSSGYNQNTSRTKYIFRPMMIIDLIAILPFYLSMFNLDFGFLRALRILRIFKLFRLSKFAQVDNLILSIVKDKKEEFLFILISLLILVLTITPLVYYFEKDAQPEVFSSMLTTMWWAIITFTTVGYGDMYPITFFGRVLTTIVSFLGIAFYAIPGSIFTSALLEKIDERKRRKREKEKKSD